MKRWACLAVMALAAGCLSGLAAPAAAGHPTGRVAPDHLAGRNHHAGRWLTDRHGRVVVDHGLNLVIKKPPFRPAHAGFGADDARFLHRHGFTAVRLGVLMEALEPKPGHFDAAYLRNIRRTQAMLARHGIRSLIDFHQDLYNERFQGEGLPTWMVDDDGLPAEPQAGFPGNYFGMPALQHAFDNFWNDAKGPRGRGLQEWYAGAWARVAKAFRHRRGVIGYDIFNEPWPGTTWQRCFPPEGCPDFDRNKLAPFSHRIIRAIHRVDPRHLTFYEPVQLFNESAPTYLGKPGDSASGFTFHVYCAAAVGAPETPPSRSACDSVEAKTLDNAQDQAKRSGDALMLSEFGATTDTSELQTVVGLADRDAIPWLEWAYCGCGDPTGSGDAEALVYRPREAPRGSNVNHTTLRFLDEPYPQRIAGTPRGYSFDQATGRFTLGYATRSPVTHRRSRARTVVFTSPLHYRHGYRVTVTGARVVARHRDRLVLVNRPRARAVRLTLRPR